MKTIAPVLVTGDISGAMLARALEQPSVAWDIETTGLDWRADLLATCQLALGEEIVLVQLERGHTPSNLQKLLEAPQTRKVFHHAPFDLRFMSFQWGAAPSNVACTKIAAKIADPGLEHESYSLRGSLRRLLGINIDKTERLSDWSLKELSAQQQKYAATDVAHLLDLLRVLERRATDRGHDVLLAKSFEYLPHRVRLDLMGAGDVFSY